MMKMMPMHEIWNTLREKERKIHGGIKMALLFSPLFFYLYLEKPELPIFTFGLFIFWGVALYLDMSITMSLKDLVKRHESNDIFRNLYKKYGKKAVSLQLGIESVFVVLFPSLTTLRQPGEPFEIDLMGAAILAGIIGVLHVFAWRSNKKEIAIMKDMKLI